MKVQLNQTLQTKNKKQTTPIQNNSKVAFGGGEPLVQFLNFLQTNQAWGATGTDVVSMGLPRTITDFTKRGPDAGVETMRREFSSTINDALLGIYGLGAASLLALGFNKKYGVQAHKMFVSDEMYDILGHHYVEQMKATGKDKPTAEVLKHIITEVKAFNPTHEKSKEGYVRFGDVATEDDINEIVQKLESEIKKTSKKIDLDKKSVDYLSSKIVTATGAEHKFKLDSITGKANDDAISSLETFLQSTYKTLKTFTNEKVATTFKNGAASENAFINGVKRLGKGTSILGLAASVAVGLSLQPLNMYLTRKKTGKTGFVGVEGREPDKSAGFKALKSTIAAAAAALVVLSIGKPKQLLEKVRFKSLAPTLDQFKLVYGATIASRIVSARDKNELRETTFKDSLGFINWLILGGFVSTLTAAGLEKMTPHKFIRHYEGEDKGIKKWFRWLTGSDVVTRNEAMHEAIGGLKNEAGKALSFIKEDGSVMKFGERLKLIKKFNPAGAKRVQLLSLIQLAGYLYTIVVLGVGIPRLNIAITNAAEKKKKIKEQQSAPKTDNQAQIAHKQDKQAFKAFQN